MLPLLFAVMAATPPQQPAGYVTMLGSDTVAVERFVRLGNRMEGQILAKTPFVTLRTWMVEYGPAGRPSRAEVSTQRPGEPQPFTVTRVTVTQDSVITETRRDTATQRRALALPGPVLILPAGPNSSWAVTELLAEQFRSSRSDSVAFTGYFPGAQAPTVISWARMGRDSVRIRSGDGMWLGRLDNNGKLEGVTPRAGTQLFSTRRVAALDVPQIATAWRAREQQSSQAGLLSPRDTVRASVAGANLTIDYGRPSKRGRTIFGSPLAPWGAVWRTGANAATQLRVDRAIEIGGVTLQPGAYTLWTIPNETGNWKLLINTQTGQWGTAHDPARDIFQLDLRTEPTRAPVERFTISVQPAGNGGTLVLEWDTTRASIPFTVRN